jgi:hypothetical protein
MNLSNPDGGRYTSPPILCGVKGSEWSTLVFKMRYMSYHAVTLPDSNAAEYGKLNHRLSREMGTSY